MMIYSCFYDEVVQYRLNHHGYCLDFVSDVDCNTFLPRIQNFQARKILVSSRENFTLNTRTKNVGDLASKKSGGGSHAKKHPSGCKVTTIVMQSYNLRNAIPNIFD